MAKGKKDGVKTTFLEPWIDSLPAHVVFPLKSYKAPKLETIEEEREEKYENENNESKRHALLLTSSSRYGYFSGYYSTSKG